MTSYYGAPHPSAATERTEEHTAGGESTAGYVCTRNTSTATEHADATQNLGSSNQGRASSHDEHNDATEHVNLEQHIIAEIPDILFTIDDATQIRRAFTGQQAVLHTEARGYLNEITNIAAQGWDDVYDIDDSIRWKEYIAMHAQCNDTIGDGDHRSAP